MKSFYRKGRYWLMGFCVMMSLCAKAQTYGYQLVNPKEDRHLFFLSDVLEIAEGKLLVSSPAGSFIFDGYDFRRPQINQEQDYLWFWSLTKDNKGRTWGLSRRCSIHEIREDTLIEHPATDTLKTLLKKMLHTDLVAGSNDTLYISFKSSNYYFKVAPDGTVQKMELGFEGLRNVLLCEEVGNTLITAAFNWESEADSVHLVVNHQVIPLASTTVSDQVLAHKLDKGYLVVSHDKGYWVQDGQLLKTVSLRARANNVIQGQNGNFWFATEKGAECWSQNLEQRLFTSLRGINCSAIYEDEERVIWIATKKGLYKQKSRYLLRYWADDFDLFKRDVTSKLMRYDSSLYVIMGRRVAQIDGNGLELSSLYFHRKESGATDLAKELVLSENNVFQRSHKGFSVVGTITPYARYIINDDGTYWRVGGGNIAKLDIDDNLLFSAKDSFEQLPPVNAQSPHEFQLSGNLGYAGFVDEKGKLWLHIQRKVYIMGQQGIEQVHAPEELGHELNHVLDMKQIGGVIWLGARNGFWTYFKGKFAFHPTSDSVLNYNAAVIKESESALWMHGGNGAMRIAFDTSQGSLQLHTNILNHKSGIKSTTIWSAKFWDGYMWFSSREGVSRLDVQEWLRAQKQTPTTYLTRVNQDAYQAGKTVNRFAHDQNNISISFKTYSKLGEMTPKYRYRLLGADSTWHSTLDTQVIFSGLKPGNYQFEAKATNGLGNESIAATSYAFVVDSPFWKTWWFLLVSFLGLQSLVGGIIWRMNTMRRKVMASEKDALEAELKTLRMQINPHFMYNALNAIGGGRDEAAAHQMAEFANLSRMILEASRQNIISLSDELGIASTYLRFITKYSEGNVQHEVQIAPEVNGSLEMVEVPPLLLQPLLENAIQHGASKVQEGRVRLAVNHANNLVEITIEDNGLGMATSTQRPDRSASAGIPILVERIEKLNRARDGNIKISWQSGNNKDQGTLVRITIPHTTK